MNFGYNNRWIRLVKDLLFVALGVWLVSRPGFFTVLLGMLAIAWYGRDAYYQAKVLWQEKHYKPAESTTAPREDGKITVHTGDAKEVSFEKE